MTNPSHTELLPCPWCGSKADEKVLQKDNGCFYWIQCTDLFDCAKTDGRIYKTPKEAVDEYLKYWNADGWSRVESFNEFKEVLSAKIGGVLDKGMKARLRVAADTFSDKEYVHVDGIDAEDQIWALSFTSWGEWREMEVQDDTGLDLNISQIAGHLYYEITWHGWETAMEERRDELSDRITELNRSLDSGEFKGTTIDQFLKDLDKDA